MEITAALFAAVAPVQLVAPESPGVLFTDAFTEAVSTEPVEPSAWTLLNPVVGQEDIETKRPALRESSDEPQNSEQVMLAAPQSPLLPPKPPLQLQFPSKELTDGVKKLAVNDGVVATAGSVLEEDVRLQSDGSIVVNETTQNQKKPPESNEHLAFTARILKPDIQPQIKDTAAAFTQLRRPLPTVSVPGLRLSKPEADDTHSAAERPVPFVEAWQKAQIETPGESKPIESASAPARIAEQPEVGSVEPVRQIAVDVEGVEGQLRIRIAERAGEMRAWVTGEAPAAVEKVQAGLSDLSRALNNAGFESEVWTPKTVNAPTSASDVQTSTEQNDQNLFGGSDAGAGNNHHGSGEDNRRPGGDDDDDRADFKSYMRNS
jgi:hypothetical protein